MIDNGDGTFSGFMVDLLDALSKQDGFSYEIGLNPDDKYGSQDGSGHWDGMIGEVLQDVSNYLVARISILQRDFCLFMKFPFDH